MDLCPFKTFKQHSNGLKSHMSQMQRLLFQIKTMVFSCLNLLLFWECTNLLHPRWWLVWSMKRAMCQLPQLSKRASFIQSGGTEISLQCMWVGGGRLPREDILKSAFAELASEWNSNYGFTRCQHGQGRFKPLVV